MLTDQLANALRNARGSVATNPHGEVPDRIALQLGAGFALATAAILRFAAQTSNGVAIGSGIGVLFASIFTASIAASRAESAAWDMCIKEYGR